MKILKYAKTTQDFFLWGGVGAGGEKPPGMSKIKWVIIALPNRYFLERGLYLPGTT